MNLFNLGGKVAVVTGGNRGMGLGMAEGIASLGANIAIAGRDTEAAMSALTALRSLGVKAEFVAADMTKKGDCYELIARTERLFGRVDILVNNAGATILKAPQDYTEEDWHSVMNTNLTGAFFCCQAAYHAMTKVGGGKIINVGSLFALFGAAFATPYAASKGGIVQMSRSMATAWARTIFRSMPCCLDGSILTLPATSASKCLDCMRASRIARLSDAGVCRAIWLVSRHSLRARHPIS
jgi:2-dehydro-3-deoxy-D-gluconate 5-dehydrogenase